MKILETYIVPQDGDFVKLHKTKNGIYTYWYIETFSEIEEVGDEYAATLIKNSIS